MYCRAWLPCTTRIPAREESPFNQFQPLPALMLPLQVHSRVAILRA